MTARFLNVLHQRLSLIRRSSLDKIAAAVTLTQLLRTSTFFGQTIPWERRMRTKAAVLYEMGQPAPYSKSQPLQIEDLELEAPGRGELLVEVVAAGLCHSDLSVIDGSRPRVMPMVIGHEAAGIVREVGPGVEEFKQDDHVIFT